MYWEESVTKETVENRFLHWLQGFNRIIYRIVRISEYNPDSQKDLYQEILFQLWCSVPQFKGQAKDSTWIYRVALNTAMVWQRKEKRERTFASMDAAVIDWPAPAGIDEAHSPETRLEEIYKAIGTLPKPERALILMQLDGLSYQEMAEVTGLTESNIGVKLSRIKQKLTQLIQGE